MILKRRFVSDAKLNRWVNVALVYASPDEDAHSLKKELLADAMLEVGGWPVFWKQNPSVLSVAHLPDHEVIRCAVRFRMRRPENEPVAPIA